MSDADDITEVVEFFALVPSAVAVAACATSGRDHWFYCKEHKVKWWGGSNLIRTQEPMTAAEVATTARYLKNFVEVAPYHPKANSR